VAKRSASIIGGHSEAAARRAGRLGDGFFPASREFVPLIAAARTAAAAEGRDPKTLEITVSIPDDPAELEVLQRHGVDRVLIPSISGKRLSPPIRGPEDLPAWSERIKRYARA